MSTGVVLRVICWSFAAPLIASCPARLTQLRSPPLLPAQRLDYFLPPPSPLSPHPSSRRNPSKRRRATSSLDGSDGEATIPPRSRKGHSQHGLISHFVFWPLPLAPRTRLPEFFTVNVSFTMDFFLVVRLLALSRLTLAMLRCSCISSAPQNHLLYKYIKQLDRSLGDGGLLVAFSVTSGQIPPVLHRSTESTVLATYWLCKIT